MKDLHAQIRDQQRAAGTRVLRVPHALGFLDPPPSNHQPGPTSCEPHPQPTSA